MTHNSPAHGGCLNQAIKKYAVDKTSLDKTSLDKTNWLDLSTGINPNGWPVPTIPASVYNRLPENDDGLIEAARAYYQTKNILPVSGSQEAIQLLPIIFQQHDLLPKNAKVGIISPCYAEHEFQWQKNNFSILHLTTETVDDIIEQLDVLLLINPNNPTGERIAVNTIKAWQSKLSQHNGYLIIDEAFMDSTPENSILGKCPMDNLIVLRSVGKFFGLAGVRCGFVIARRDILSLLEYHQGPWSVSGPTRWLVKKALSDTQWIADNKGYLKNASGRLETLLKKYLSKNNRQIFICGTVLYKTIFMQSALPVFEQLAKKGVLVRLLDKSCSCKSCTAQYKTIDDQHKGLRFGLPADEKQWQQLEIVLQSIRQPFPSI